MSPSIPPPASQEPKFLDRLRTALLIRGRPPDLTEALVGWVRQFIVFHRLRHPDQMAEAEVGAFLTYLAVEGEVSASTQLQAFHALLFLYQQVLQVELGRLDALRARRPEFLPVVLSRDEVRQVLAAVRGADGLYPVMA